MSRSGVFNIDVEESEYLIFFLINPISLKNNIIIRILNMISAGIYVIAIKTSVD